MKHLICVILMILFVLNGSVFAGKRSNLETAGKEVISAENRGIILHHFINISLEKGNFSNVSLSYKKLEEGEKLEMMGMLAPNGRYGLLGFVCKGNPVVTVIKIKDEKTTPIFIDQIISADKKWARTFYSKKCKDSWLKNPGESFFYSQNRGKEISQAMDCLANAKDDQFALGKDGKNLKIAYNVSENGKSGNHLVIFSNKKTPLIIHGEIKEGEVKYSSFEFDTAEGSEPSEWFTLPIPDDGQIGQ